MNAVGEQEEQMNYDILTNTSSKKPKRGGKILLWQGLITRNPMIWSRKRGYLGG